MNDTKMINGWEAKGMADPYLRQNPSLFTATKGNMRLSMTYTPIQTETVRQEEFGEWRLFFNSYAVASTRSLEDILARAKRFMEYK